MSEKILKVTVGVAYALLGLVLLGLSILVFDQAYSGKIASLATNPVSTILSAIVTYLLVGVTIWYANSSRGLLEETKRARVQETMPIFILDFNTKEIKPDTIAYLRNVGRGPAHNIKAKVKLVSEENKNSDQDEMITAPLLRVGYGLRTALFSNMDLDTNDLSNQYDKLELNVEYRYQPEENGDSDKQETDVLYYDLLEYPRKYDKKNFNITKRKG